ncbi:hypothetical protein [Vibrio phage VpJYP1]|nr:hypothetical protein [Vibrio phage VpJYP1]
MRVFDRIKVLEKEISKLNPNQNGYWILKKELDKLKGHLASKYNKINYHTVRG